MFIAVFQCRSMPVQVRPNPNQDERITEFSDLQNTWGANMKDDELRRTVRKAAEEFLNGRYASRDGNVSPTTGSSQYSDPAADLAWSVKRLRWMWDRPEGKATDPLHDEALPHIVAPYLITLILGGRGSGKTALGFRLLELYRDHQSDKYIVGGSRSAVQLLPKWIKYVDSIFTLPDNSIALIDEAHLRMGPHISEADRRELASMLALTRQRQQTLFIISQQARTISREIVAAADILVFKALRQNQIKFDRPEFTQAMESADQALGTVFGDRKAYAFVYSPEDRLQHLMRSVLPEFWSEPLSRTYADASPIKSLRDESQEKRRRLISRANELRRQGFSYGAIAKRLGISKGTTWNYVNLI